MVSSIQVAQQRYKHHYDRKSRPVIFKLGHWVLVRFPQDKIGKQRKLSWPWHRPYGITQINDPCSEVLVMMVQSTPTRVCLCPEQLPAGFYWYGGNRRSAGKVPRRVERLLSQGDGRPDASNIVHSSDAVNEDSMTRFKTTPSDTLDESCVQDRCSSSGGAVPPTKNLPFTQPLFNIP